MSQETIANIEHALQLAFIAGRWRGQVDLEEDMDNNSYFDAFLTHLHALKSGGEARHTVASSDINSRPVRYNLRSDEWREGVKKTTDEYLDRARGIIFESLDSKMN